MTDNKTCSVDILSVSLGEEGYLIIPRQTRELCEPLVKAADALERALENLPVDEADKNQNRTVVGRTDGPSRAIRSRAGNPGILGVYQNADLGDARWA